ncbi:hypothetical protein SUGI_0591000 [Cryptomeria japonica]|nr:hypothetical protein SUGI_0591000 [Cryptomeria japonica]
MLNALGNLVQTDICIQQSDRSGLRTQDDYFEQFVTTSGLTENFSKIIGISVEANRHIEYTLFAGLKGWIVAMRLLFRENENHMRNLLNDRSIKDR